MPFLHALSRWDDQEVFDAKEAVERLLESDGWAVVLRLLEAGRDSIQGQLQYGKVLDGAEYARELGKLVGLECPVAAAEAVLLKADKIDKDAEAELAGVH